MIHTAQDLKTYRSILKQAIENRFLRDTLDNFSSAYKESRANAFAGMDLESLVREIADSKDASISRLEELFQTFKAHAESAGIQVHTAGNASEANAIISDIARARGVEKIIKSKSMTAEETFLNDALEKQGMQVTETDLGEWIIQQRREGPSHMVMPAIHLARGQVADLFTRVTGAYQNPDDITDMVRTARKLLRRAYLEADMGISGANFAVADSGTIGIVTNEGNARLVTTLPPVHVALVGYDKLVPDLKSALRILEVLPKNATGQIISTYVTWITGANECAPGPKGFKEMHIVFLDNGRLALARSPIFRQALRCIRCGACANLCPIYRLVGGHNYGHVYMGAIGLILTYFYHGKDNARTIVQNCLNCQACKEVCPAGIDLPFLIKEVYRTVLKEDGKRPIKNMLLSNVLKDRKRFHFLLRKAALAQKPLKKDAHFIRHLPLFFLKEQQFRSLPALASVPFRDQWERSGVPTGRPRFRVAVFGGCLVDFVYPEQGRALMQLLKAYDVHAEYPLEQTCCGLPALMTGEKETAQDLAIRNARAIRTDEVDFVLTLCASCGSHIKENYPKLFRGQPDVCDQVSKLSNKLIDFSSFMVDVLEVQREDFMDATSRAAYHAPCHLCRGLGVIDAPKSLMTSAGLEPVPMEKEDVCCGLGGSYSFDFPEISAQLLQEKLDNAVASGADLLLTDCPGCVLQLRGGAAAQKRDLRVKHLVEAVAERKKIDI